MRKFLISTALVVLFGTGSAYAWGSPYLTPAQNYQKYLNCVNTAKYGTEKQQILADSICYSLYGVKTHNP